MKRKILNLSVAIASLLVVTSCSNDIDDSFVADLGGEGDAIEMIVLTESKKSRTETNEDAEGNFKVEWSAGDELGVFCDYKGSNTSAVAANQVKYSLGASTGTAGEASFTGSLKYQTPEWELENGGESGGTYRFYMYYPHNVANSGATKGQVKGVLPTSQNFDMNATAYVTKHELLVGRVVDQPKGSAIAVTMNRKFALMAFSITNNRAEEIVVTNVDMVVVDDNSQSLSGEYTIDVNGPANSSKPQFSPVISEVGTAVIDGAIGVGEMKKVKLLMNGADLSGKKVKVTVTTASGLKIESIENGIDFKMGGAYNKSISIEAGEVTPIINAADVTIDGAAGEYYIIYNILNPTTGDAVVPTITSGDFINTLVNNEGKITFSADENGTSESRTAVVTLTYGAVVKTVNVTQIVNLSLGEAFMWQPNLDNDGFTAGGGVFTVGAPAVEWTYPAFDNVDGMTQNADLRGLQIGKGAIRAEMYELSTANYVGKILTVAVTAGRGSDGSDLNLQLKVNGVVVKYLDGQDTTPALSRPNKLTDNSLVEYIFTLPTPTELVGEGRVEIIFKQTKKMHNIYVKQIKIN